MEASLVVPIFFLAIYTFIFIIQILSCQDKVAWALDRVALESSIENAVADNELIKTKVYLLSKLGIYLDQDMAGFSFSKACFDEEDSSIDFVVEYDVTLPVSLFGIKSVPVIQRVRTRAFCGVETRTLESVGDEEVYITETGSVYHRSLTCTYLKLSISQVLYQDLEGLRNASGGKYKACHVCCLKKVMTGTDIVFVTNYGDRYHDSLSCHEMKRTIKTVKRSEVGNRLPCSKCGSGGSE